jgi:hypothetical protein
VPVDKKEIIRYLRLESKLQEQEESILAEQLDFEIECPRCKDVMELFSEFDYLSYYCDG